MVLQPPSPILAMDRRVHQSYQGRATLVGLPSLWGQAAGPGPFTTLCGQGSLEGRQMSEV